MLDIYDRLGIVVMDENREFFGNQEYWDNMADLVRRDRNHPSVTIWSFCNEGACNAADGAGFRAVTYEYDGTRPVLGNHNGNPALNKNMDVQGFSHSSRDTLSAYHAQFPSKPEFSSECCSCNTQRGEDFGGDGIESSFNGPCIAQQTNWSNGVDYVSGSMVWTLFDYYGEPSFNGWPHVSSTFGSFDLAGFPKAAVWWYRSFWLNAIPDTAADKTFETGDQHIVRIVQSWDKPVSGPLPPPNNKSYAYKCDPDLTYQDLSYVSGRIQWGDLCLDGGCASITTGCAPLAFLPCSAGLPTQQWEHNTSQPTAPFVSKANSSGCLDLWNSGSGPDVGIYLCDGSSNQNWAVTDAAPEASHAPRIVSEATNPTGRCLSNGDRADNTIRSINVYSDLPSVELFLNGASLGAPQNLTNPGLSGGPSWGTWTVAFTPGNLTAVGYGRSNAIMARNTVITTGDAVGIVLTVDAPSPISGTGSKMLLDGQDVALLRATVVDASGRHVTHSAHNLTFEIVSGPGRVVGTNNGDPQCHVANHLPGRPAYHGLLRAVIMGTVHSAGPAELRDRIVEIDVDSGLQTKVVSGATPPTDPAPIVVRAFSAGLSSGTVSILTSNDADTDGVLAVAAAMAGKPVSFE